MRRAKVLFKDLEAGEITQHNNGSFTFSYNEAWLHDSNKPAISPTLPKRDLDFHSDNLFPFFFNLLPEGSNRQAVCSMNKLDPADYFGILLTTARFDSIGAIRVVKVQ